MLTLTKQSQASAVCILQTFHHNLIQRSGPHGIIKGTVVTSEETVGVLDVQL